jgi:hypothetical protein
MDAAHMKRVIALCLVAVAACAGVAWAASRTVKLTDRKGDAKIGADLRAASVTYNGTTVRHLIVARGSFNTQSAPCLVISTKTMHDLLICNDGHVLGFGQHPGNEPKVKVTRPSSKSIAYTFKPGKLGLKVSYLWSVNGQGRPDNDSIPNKGCAVEQLTTDPAKAPNPPKKKSCRKFR